MKHRAFLWTTGLAAFGLVSAAAIEDARACGLDPTNHCHPQTQQCNAACTPLSCQQRIASFDDPPNAVSKSFFAGAIENCGTRGDRAAILACAWQEVVALTPEVASDTCMKQGLESSPRTQQKLAEYAMIARSYRTITFTAPEGCDAGENDLGLGTSLRRARPQASYLGPQAPPQFLDWVPPPGNACGAANAVGHQVGLGSFGCIPHPPRTALSDPANPFGHNVGANEGRLRGDLRGVAQAQDPLACAIPMAAYEYAQVGLPDQPDAQALGDAYADLAVTGRVAFSAFIATPPNEAYCNAIVVPGPSSQTATRGCPIAKQGPQPANGRPGNDPAMPSHGQLVAGCKRALDRAYKVANYLRAGQTARSANWFLSDPAPADDRGKLGWIAVSGEDDEPLRPVNVPATRFPQFETDVSVEAPLANWPHPTPTPPPQIVVHTRYVVAQSNAPAPTLAPATGWSVASGPDHATIAPDSDVLIFVHGMGSRAEEADDITKYLYRRLHTRGRNLAIISVDLPSSGYATNLWQAQVSPLDAIGRTLWRPLPVPVPVPAEIMGMLFVIPGIQFALPPPGMPLVIPPGVPLPDFMFSGKTPLLDFIEQFIVNFVEKVDSVTPIRKNIRAVMGGSLGGNMSFRLGRRPSTALHNMSWLTNVIVWSPASIWDSLGGGDGPTNLLKHIGPRSAFESANKAQTTPGVGDRQAFFGGWDQPTVPLLMAEAQSDTWQSDYFACKKTGIASARLDREETYDARANSWHWRLAAEQLLFSHQTIVRPQDATPLDPLTNQPRYMSNRKRMLLACGTEDHVMFNDICPATVNTAPHMTATPGKAIFLTMTGHSVDNERRKYFANEVAEFLGFVPTPALLAMGTACATDDVCASNRCDAAPGNARRCIPNDGTGNQGEYCSHNNQCLNRSCNGGHCATALALGQVCESNTGCLSGRCDNAQGNPHKCIPNDHTGNVGDYCTHNNQCSNANCGVGTNWRCDAAAPLAQACQSNAGCASNRCDNAPGNPHLCIPNDGQGHPGDYCTHPHQCSNNNCVNQHCMTGAPNGQACGGNQSCASGRCDNAQGNPHACIPNDGHGNPGEYCTHNNQCLPGHRCNLAPGNRPGLCN